MGQEEDEREADEGELFRRAMRDVQPLKRPLRAPPGRRNVRPRAKFARAERAAVLRESLGSGADLYDVQPGDEQRALDELRAAGIDVVQSEEITGSARVRV